MSSIQQLTDWIGTDAEIEAKVLPPPLLLFHTFCQLQLSQVVFRIYGVRPVHSSADEVKNEVQGTARAYSNSVRPILLFSHWYIRQENRKQKYEDNHKRERRHVFHIYVYLHCICICKLSYGRAQRAAPGPGQARRLSSFGAEDLAARAANHRDFRRRVDDSETSQHDAVVSSLSDVHVCAAVDPICRYIHVSTRV